MGTETEPNPAPSGRGGRGGRGRGGRGRGRGGGRGGAANNNSNTTASNTAGVTKQTAPRGGRGKTGRGRAKTFADTRVQAAYERQRDLKSLYQSVATVLKPALQELAERNIDELINSPDGYKQVDGYEPLMNQLQEKLDTSLQQNDKRFELDTKLAESTYQAEQDFHNKQFENAFDDLLERFLDAQTSRLRILDILHQRQLPVDVEDINYEYKVISDEHFDKEFGRWEEYQDGHLVPYPCRVEGTKMWQKARDSEAAAAVIVPATTASSLAPTTTGTRGRGRGRGGTKRKAQDQADGLSTPKRSTRNTEDPQLLDDALSLDPSADTPVPSAAPAPVKGLLASAAEADLLGDNGGRTEQSPSGSPEPPPGVSSSQAAATQAKYQGKIPARAKSPPLPKNIADPDEYGVRIYNQRPSFRDKGLNSRLLAPSSFEFDDLDIGFRDSTNDPTKSHHSRARRGKYLDTANSNGFHYDHWCNGYDYSHTKASDFDQETVARHALHPTYGIFLPGSRSVAEDPSPLVKPGKQIAFIANPSGRVSHASRSYQMTMNHNLVEEAPRRHKMGAALRRFCKLSDVEPEEIDVTDQLASDEELIGLSLGTAAKELKGRPGTSAENSPKAEIEVATEGDDVTAQGYEQDQRPDLSALTQAAAFIEASETPRITPAPPAPPAPSKPAKYDAVRDMFVSEVEPATPAAPALVPVTQEDKSVLNFLADLCNSTQRNYVPAASNQDQRRASYAMPAPPMFDHEQAPMSSERESSYMPPTPIQSYPDVFQEAPQEPLQPILQAAPPRAPSVQPVQHQPVHHHAHDEHQQYMPAPQQPMHSQMEQTGHYAFSREQITAPVPPPHQQMAPEYQSQHQYAPQPHENGYGQPPHGGYPVPDHRDVQPQGYPYEHAMDRRMSNFPPENPTYSRPYWSQHPAPGPQGPPGPAPPAPIHTPTPAQAYPPPPPPPPQHGASSRLSFSHVSAAEPLPPLRPPRGRHQPVQDESMVDPSLRSGPPPPPPPPNGYNNYYPAPNQIYQQGYAPPEPHPGYRHRPSLPNPQPPHQGYMASPPPNHSYHTTIGSPTFSNMQQGGGQAMAQSPQEQQGMMPGHAFHRSSGSGSGMSLGNGAPMDANSKYRKLQPAPVPAHRTWSNNKPELKTIPYDHKDSTGGSAALPNSGPTQIRGWNVNPQRRRPRSDRRDNAETVNERDESR